MTERTPGLPSWEYKLVHISHSGAEEVLNGLGAQGWELAGIDGSFPDHPRYVFKRPLANPFVAEPELDPEQERFLRNTSIAEALRVLPSEKLDRMLSEILSDEERESPTPPDDFYERVHLWFAERREQAAENGE